MIRQASSPMMKHDQGLSPERPTRGHLVPLRIFLSFFIIVVGFCLPTPAQQYSLELAPGLIVSPERKIACVMAVGGGTAILDLRTGTPIWRTEQPFKPLMIIDHLVLGQGETAGRRGVAQIIALDVKTGGKTPLNVEIPLPEQALAIIGDEPGMSFSSSAWAENSSVVVAWSFHERQVSGVAPKPGDPALKFQARGLVKLHLDSGRIETLTADHLQPRDTLPEPVKSLVQEGDIEREPWRVNDVLASVGRRHIDHGQTVLRRWRADTGQPLPELVLLQDLPLATRASADHQHVLISSASQSAKLEERYLWSIFQLTDGELITAVTNHASAPPFFLVENLFIYVSQRHGLRVDGRWQSEPRILRAVDLRSHDEVWSYPILDLGMVLGLPPASLPPPPMP